MKTYVLMISKVFPAYHPRAGHPTFFKEAIAAGIEGNRLVTLTTSRRVGKHNIILNEQAGKLHTLRGSYDLWKKRAEKINRGEAILSLREWSGKPYASKQEEFMQLTKVGVQEILISRPNYLGRESVFQIAIDRKKIAAYSDKALIPAVDQGKEKVFQNICKNDGLSVDDFCKYFKNPLDGCIIHFTDFRYL